MGWGLGGYFFAVGSIILVFFHSIFGKFGGWISLGENVNKAIYCADLEMVFQSLHVLLQSDFNVVIFANPSTL